MYEPYTRSADSVISEMRLAQDLSMVSGLLENIACQYLDVEGVSSFAKQNQPRRVGENMMLPKGLLRKFTFVFAP